jgi:hypothetical protein
VLQKLSRSGKGGNFCGIRLSDVCALTMGKAIVPAVFRRSRRGAQPAVRSGYEITGTVIC